MELLLLLVERNGELVSREEISQRLWGADVFVDVDLGINTAVRKVRTALRDDPEKPRFVETVVGKGYRFAAPVAAIGETTPSVRVGLPATPQPALAGQGAASAVTPRPAEAEAPLPVSVAGGHSGGACNSCIRLARDPRTQDRKLGAAPDQIPRGLAVEESLGQPS